MQTRNRFLEKTVATLLSLGATLLVWLPYMDDIPQDLLVGIFLALFLIQMFTTVAATFFPRFPFYLTNSVLYAFLWSQMFSLITESTLGMIAIGIVALFFWGMSALEITRLWSVSKEVYLYDKKNKELLFGEGYSRLRNLHLDMKQTIQKWKERPTKENKNGKSDRTNC